MKKFTNDHRVRMTKLLLRRAFCDLLRQKSIFALSVSELCAKAGVSRATFYTHYTDLFDLLEQIESEMLEDFKHALAPLYEAGKDGPSPVEITAGVFACLKDNADICNITLGPYGDKVFAQKLVNLGYEKYVDVYTALYQKATKKQIEFYYAFVSTGCIGLLQKWLDEGMTTPAMEVAQTAEGIMRYGLGFLQQPQAR